MMDFKVEVFAGLQFFFLECIVFYYGFLLKMLKTGDGEVIQVTHRQGGKLKKD